MWGQIASALIGGIMTNRAAKKAAKAQREAGEQAYQRTVPRGVSGLFGSFGYDEQGGSTMALSGDLQSQFDALMGRAGQTGQQIQNLNPLELQKSLYEQQYGLLQPQQERETLEQESRLLQQGRLGSTGGAGQMQALQEAQGQQRAGLLASSYGVAQQTMDSMRQREAMDRQQALGIGALPMQYANVSGAMAGLMGAGAQFAGTQASGAAVGLGGTQANYWANMMEQFGDRKYDKLGGLWGGGFGSGGNVETTRGPMSGAAWGGPHG